MIPVKKVQRGPRVLVHISPYPDFVNKRPEYLDKVSGYISTPYLTQQSTPQYMDTLLKPSSLDFV